MVNKQQLLDQIKADILKNSICPDLAETAKQLVFGDGNPDADIVFIGEAPGKKEDEQGIPFVGASGKFLNEMLEMIDLKREDIYITNIVKYRPPNNRDPLPTEKKAFLPYLQKQIAVIEPKMIVTLGRHSMDAILPGLKISQSHGVPQRIRVNFNARVGRPVASVMQGADETGSPESLLSGVKLRTEPYQEYGEGVAQSATQQHTATWVILPLFHPAAALYNGGLRQTLLEDFQRIPSIIKEIQN